MNKAITLAFKGDANEILVGPEVAYSEQRRNFRKLKASLTGYDSLELWCASSGRVKQYKFKSKVAAPSAPETDTTTEAETGAPVSDLTPTGAINDTTPAPAKPAKAQRKKAPKKTAKAKAVKSAATNS